MLSMNMQPGKSAYAQTGEDAYARVGASAFALMEKLNYVRVAGTDGEIGAAGVLCGELSAMGLEPRLEPFKIDGYEIKKAALRVVKPYEMEFPVTGCGLSGNTPAGGLRAQFLYAEDCDDISLSMARGKIVLLNTPVKPAHYHKMVDAGVAGFITVSGTAIDERDKTDLETRALRADRHLKSGALRKIPGVTIRAIDALEMLRSEPEEVEIILEQVEMKITSNNVIVEIMPAWGANVDNTWGANVDNTWGANADNTGSAGVESMGGANVKDARGAEGEWVTIGAHYDSVPFSPGMYDNAAGSAIIMEACRWFAVNRPRRPLRFIWFGAEERGLLGSRYHIAANPEEIKASKLMINVDLAGQIIGNHAIMVTAQKSVGDFLRFMAQEIGFGLKDKQNIYSSDSTAYADAGVPSFSFLRGGTIGHNRHDIISLCSPATMAKSANFMIYITDRIVNSVAFPIPPGIPDDLKEKLDIYFGRKPPEDE